MLAYGGRVINVRRRRHQAGPVSALTIGCAVLLAACGSGTAASPTSATQPPSTSAATSTPSATPSPTPTPSSTAAAVSATVTATTRPKPVTVKPKPVPVVRDVLTGGVAKAGPLLAAKIDNTSAGFPQFGVAKADIVYVEQVEGGLTRLIVLFRSSLPNEVGPIRSVRSTDTELLTSYGKVGLVFSGGAGGPMTMLGKTTLLDLSPASAGSAYWRSDVGDGTHNLHVDLAKLAAENPAIGQPRSPGFQFAAGDPRLAKAKNVTSIQVTMLAGHVSFSYAGGRYTPQHGTSREAYVDHDGSTVLADNVLVQNVTDEPDGTVDSVGAPSYLSHTIGKGTFTLFRDGKSISGTWKRDKPDAPTAFLDGAGKPVLFKPGKTWVVLAPQTTQVVTG